MTEIQKNFLISIGIDPEMSADELEDKVGDYLTLQCLDDNYEPNEEGKICQSILDYIATL